MVDFGWAVRQAEFVNPAAEAIRFESEPRDPRLERWLKDYPPSIFSEQLYQSIELMERYSIELAAGLLDQLALGDPLRQWSSPEELCRLLCFQQQFRFAIGWILQRLIETGCIEERTDADTRRYRLRETPKLTGIGRLRAAGINIDPANEATLDLLDHAASLYPAVAQGKQNGEQGMFDSCGIALWLNYFSNANLTYAVNNWIGAVAAAERLSSRSRLRILELGAGAGSGTEVLLRCLDERELLPRIERYVATEPNAFFRRRAQRELAKLYPSVAMEWAPLDVNSPWKKQETAIGEFDLIYAVNVFHVARDLSFSLNEARSALANDGWLVIGECLRPSANQPIYPELMFQILESFIAVETDADIRPNPGFLTADQWRRAFARGGIERVEVAPDVESIHEIYPHFFTGAICGQNSVAGNQFG